MRYPGQHHRYVLALSALTLSTLLTSCSTAPSSSVLPPVQQHAAGIGGIVHGGQQLVSNATVQLWAVGTAGVGSAATPLLNTPVSSDSQGRFNITGDYTCPSADTLVYLTATGGNPGMIAGTNNNALVMLVALGSCGSLSSSTYVVMNEITTAGSIFALAPYMTSYSAIGYSGDASGITDAFSMVNQYVNIATGTPSGPSLPTGYGVDEPLINTIADTLAACVNSAGGTSDDGSSCGKLFNLTGGGTTTNIASAALHIANNPTTNLADLFNLISSSSPFQPTYNAAPTSYALVILPQVPTPTITVTPDPTGTYATITITDPNPNASIYYVNSNVYTSITPTTSSTLYTGPFSVSAASGIAAIAAIPGDLNSSVTTAGIAQGSTLTFAPPAGTYSSQQTVTLSPNYGYTYYTIDGSTPTTASIRYTGSITVPVSETITAAEFPIGGLRGNVTSAAYVITQVAPPTISIPSGTYTSTINVSLADPTPGAAIYYTTDGSTPTTASTLFTGPVSISSTSTLKAIGIFSGMTASTASSASYIIDPNAPLITTIAGTGGDGSCNYTADGDGGPASAARFCFGIIFQTVSDAVSTQSGNRLTFDASGNLYVLDDRNHLVRKISTSGTISSFLGHGPPPSQGGVGSPDYLFVPTAIGLDGSGNLYYSDASDFSIYKITPGGASTQFVGYGVSPFATAADPRIDDFNIPTFVVSSSGVTYHTSSEFPNMIYRNAIPWADAGGGANETVYAGSDIVSSQPSGDNGPAIQANLGGTITNGMAFDAAGNLYLAFGTAVRKIDTNGIITLFAGNYTCGNSGDGAAATSAELCGANSIAIDATGNVYIADNINHNIRKVDVSGTITTVAGNGTTGFYGDGLPAVDASFGASAPSSIALDATGNLYIIDDDNQRIRKVTLH